MNNPALKMSLVGLAFLALATFAVAQPVEEADADSRCAVCGMFVAKYPQWLTQIHSGAGTVAFFDGVKDMMVFYFNPQRYGGTAEAIQAVWVKDYYTLTWLDGKSAHYVIGSDVHGPMGHEFIPFASQEAAQTFVKDHHGTAVLTFDEITSQQVESMRMGMKMKKMKMHQQ
jgi:nitrous oxide reductase accessory protein NosL